MLFQPFEIQMLTLTRTRWPRVGWAHQRLVPAGPVGLAVDAARHCGHCALATPGERAYTCSIALPGGRCSFPTVFSLVYDPRHFRPQASAVCIGHGNLLFVHGGRNNFVLEDLHMLDFVVGGVCTKSCTPVCTLMMLHGR